MAQAVENINKAQYLKGSGHLNDSAPGWLRTLRTTGVESFNATPLPHARMEEWRQTNIAPINNTAYESIMAPLAHGLTPADLAAVYFDEPTWRQAVFVDGFYDESLSRAGGLPLGVHVASLQSALSGAEAKLVEAHLGRHTQQRNAYTALNTALAQDGAFVHVSKNCAVDTPIHLVFISSTARETKAANIRNLIVLEEGAEVKIILSFVAQEGNINAYFNNVVQEVCLGVNAGLTLHKLVNEGDAGRHLDTLEISQERDSRLKAFNCTHGGDIVRNQLCVSLNGGGADCDLTGLYLNDADHLIDNALNITHHAPNCRSRIGYKGILADSSKAVFLGKVYVHPEAQGTDSDQLSNNLLLSDSATVDTKPQLEIYADDVKCTHGTTVGSPPEEVVFYFRSRGIDEAVARGMLTYGFADEIVQALEIAEVKERLEKMVYARYSPKEAG